MFLMCPEQVFSFDHVLPIRVKEGPFNNGNQGIEFKWFWTYWYYVPHFLCRHLVWPGALNKTGHVIQSSRPVNCHCCPTQSPHLPQKSLLVFGLQVLLNVDILYHPRVRIYIHIWQWIRPYALCMLQHYITLSITDTLSALIKSILIVLIISPCITLSTSYTIYFYHCVYLPLRLFSVQNWCN